MEYISEQIWAGQLGNFFVILAFVSAILSTYAFFRSAANPKDDSIWKLARTSFLTHLGAVIGIAATLFYMLLTHRFEYQYVWEHSNMSMPMRYILSCFWEGQEGSFLLWTFWQAVLGTLVLRKRTDMTAPVLTIIASVQVFLVSMLLGIYIGDYKLGINPFTILLRDNPEWANLPLFRNPDYLSNMDGRGLNPLLQNYWMVIHPPTLFLGFAATVVPFAYALAALWKRQFKGWISSALAWSFFGVSILGIGILMGGAWAYEALSFGGFWAWDPVENASLVPWMTLVAGAHLLLLQRGKGHSFRSTFVFLIISYLLVLYSTFLTRSGILGDTSVHSFTASGLDKHLLVFQFFYLGLGLWMIISRWKSIPAPKEEEPTWTREFWMFISALIFFLGAIYVSASTSLPVVNKIFGTNLAPPEDVFAHYHKFMIPVAILLAFLIGFVQYMNYRKAKWPSRKVLFFPVIAAVGLTALFQGIFQFDNFFYILLLLATSYGLAANTEYFIRVFKGSIKKGSSSIAHVGFALVLLGALISTAEQKIISANRTGVDISQLGELADRENILLMKDDTLLMGDYFVAYRGRDYDGLNMQYQVDYMVPSEQGMEHAFTLYPRVQLNDRMGNVAEPDTRHFWDKDIYTHVTYAQLEPEREHDDQEVLKSEVQVGDTLVTKSHLVVFERILRRVDTAQFQLTENDIAVGAQLKILDKDESIHYAAPFFIIRNKESLETPVVKIPEAGMEVALTRINPETEEFEITYSEDGPEPQDYIIMQAIVFPGINILWIGCVLLFVGTLLAVIQRIRR